MNPCILWRRIAFALTFAASGATAAPVGTAFTYQGELRVAGAPASVPHDFEFALFNVATGGAVIATVARGDLAVNAGLFTTELDYTDVPFAASEEYWLEVRVRDGASTGAYTPLLPRQKLTPAPYALNARTVQAGGVNSAAIATGAVGTAQIADNAVGTSQILNSSVTLADLAAQSVGPGQLVDAAVFPQHLVTGAVTSDKIVSSAVESRHIVDGGIDAADLHFSAVASGNIQDGSIARVDLAAGAVGSAQIAGNAVGTLQIQDGAVIAADLAAQSVGGGALQDGAVITQHLGTSAVTGEKIANSTIDTGDIAAGAVGAAQLQNGAVGSLQLAPAAISPFHLSNAAVTGSKIAAAAVTTVHIAPDAVDATLLAAGAVQNDALAAAAVTGDKIANATIPASKLTFAAGDVTAVTAGVGLTGGGASGDLTLGVNTNTIQARVTGTCLVGQYFRGIAPDGSVACEPVPGLPAVRFVDAGFDVGRHASIAIGSDQLPVIAYADASANRLMVAKCSDSACIGFVTITPVDDPANAVGTHAALAVPGDGRPVIAYFDATASRLKIARCSSPDCSGVATFVTVSTPGLGTETAITIGSDGRPVISTHDSVNLALAVVHCTVPDCSAHTVASVDDTANSIGFASSIAIGADGLPVISHYDMTAQALRVVKCTTTSNCIGGLSQIAVDDSGSNVGNHSSIALGADSLLIISYHDATAGALKVAKCGDLTCSSATLTTLDDPTNLVGLYTSIAVGVDGVPVIAHHDSTANSLKLTRCADAACSGVASTSTVDDPANRVGRDASLALGAGGLPVIAYYDRDAPGLKVAKCGTRSCQ